MASTGVQFERALGWVLQSDATTKMPKFSVGTLPVEYKNGATECVATVRRNMGDELWFQSFTQSKMRHRLCHVYETLGEDESSSDDSMATKLSEKILDLSATKNDSSFTDKEKKQPSPVKIGVDSHSKLEVPYVLETIDSSSGSDSSDSGDDQEGNQTKRRRLHTRPQLLRTKQAGHKEEKRSSKPQASKVSGRTHHVVTSNKEKRASHSKGANATDE
ncbi:unnamed protein product [Phytophthora fragariaefolia]|uniref:Unnamed protein product n=1 Tax=Phytophthora fragariaefolia TaxID=1490495 RepID=A0A9W7CYI0_9STRA|nr:unnamed protein product [Phytophthora fragariaefolia]